jgi:hypothetical protein
LFAAEANATVAAIACYDQDRRFIYKLHLNCLRKSFTRMLQSAARSCSVLGCHYDGQLQKISPLQRPQRHRNNPSG